MHEPTFREALSHSWKLTVHKKSLWIFGLLSALLGQWGLSDFVGGLYRTAGNGFAPMRLNYVVDFFNAWNWHKVSVILLLLWLLGIVLLVLLSVIFIATCSRGAIIAYAQHWYKKREMLSLSEAWQKGVARVVPMFTITVVSRVLQVLVMALVSFVSFKLIQYDTLGRSLLVVVTVAVGLLLALIIESVAIYTSGYILLEQKKSLFVSLKQGWKLFTEHLMVTLELGVVLMLLTLILVGVLIYGSFIAFIPALFIWFLAGLGGLQILVSFGLVVGVFCYIVLILLLAGMFNSFVSCSWMYLFMKMHHEGVGSRVVYFLKNLFRR